MMNKNKKYVIISNMYFIINVYTPDFKKGISL